MVTESDRCEAWIVFKDALSSCSRARVSLMGADDDTGRFIECLLVWVGFYSRIGVGAIGKRTLVDA
jgi:hypothetical protein